MIYPAFTLCRPHGFDTCVCVCKSSFEGLGGGGETCIKQQMPGVIKCLLLFILSPVLMIFFRQLISVCRFQRVQIVNVLNVLSFLKQGHTGAAETVFRAQRGPPLKSSVTKLFLEEDVGLLILV